MFVIASGRNSALDEWKFDTTLAVTSSLLDIEPINV